MSDEQRRDTPPDGIAAKGAEERKKSSGAMQAVREPPRPPAKPDGRYAVHGTPIAKVSKAKSDAHPPMDEVDDDSDPGRLTATDIVLPDAIQRARNPESLPPNATETQQVLAVVRWEARMLAQIAASFGRHRDNQAKQHGENRGELGLIAGHIGAVEHRVVSVAARLDALEETVDKTVTRAAHSGRWWGAATGLVVLLAALAGLVKELVQAHDAAVRVAPNPAASSHR